MCVSKSGNKCEINRNKLGTTLKSAIIMAKKENRLICGLLPAIVILEKSAEDVLLCVLPNTSSTSTSSHHHHHHQDATIHIQAVLLQAYCYENDIPVIQVDSADQNKLATYYCDGGVQRNLIISDKMHCNCALIMRDTSLPIINNNNNNKEPFIHNNLIPMSENEEILTCFYESTLEEFPRPVIQLPI